MAEHRDYHERSILIHGRFRSEKWDFQDHILPPVSTSAAFRLRSVERGAQGFQQFANPDLDRNTTKPIYIYERLDEPCRGLLEETLAFAEKGEAAVAFASGMAAISAILGVHLKAGDHLVTSPKIYGCTYSLITHWLTRFGIRHSFCEFSTREQILDAVAPETRILYFETPSNPTLELVDLRMVVEVVREINAVRPAEEAVKVVVDNTFATPYCQRPLTMGVDFVVHSLTKNLGGFGADMGGVVVGPHASETDLLVFRKDFGGSISPHPSWHILVYGIPTLALRMERQQKTAKYVAEFLELQPGIDQVIYPGLDSYPQRSLAMTQMLDIDGNFAPGSMIYFEMAGTPEVAYRKAIRTMNYLAVNSLSITLAVSLGQIRTLVEHPASMTHSAIPLDVQVKAGISPGGIRLSIGLEDERDIARDLDRALLA
ncbi:MAG: PLP-dependent transferase [Fimbriimonas sp.]|nr:PLP-dependent transferase [Fimbriimonas sp.]